MGISTKYEFSEVGAIPAGEDGFHHIAITTPERFLELTIGIDSPPESDVDWLSISEQRLLELTRGEIFTDYPGRISRLRKEFEYFPENVWKYKMAFLLESIAWEDDLVSLCGRRGDLLSMNICTAKTIERIIRLCFALNSTYSPLYLKWLHREFAKLPELAMDIGPYLRKAFSELDYETKAICLNRSYDIIVDYMTGKGICGFYRADSFHFRGNSKYDFQRSAREILGSIEGDIGKLTIGSSPIGALDQWIANEDILLSSEHLKAAGKVYGAREMNRNEMGDSMI